jgi:hypothetical protein
MRGVAGHRVRFPIAALMAVIALLAIELASYRVASDGYVDLTRHLTVFMLAVAAYLARYREGERAAWWFGFALLGSAYFALVIDATARREPPSFSSLRPPPPTTLLGLYMSVESLPSYDQHLLRRWWNQFEILQSILTLVVACVGGTVCWIWNRRRGNPYREVERRSGTLALGDRAG